MSPLRAHPSRARPHWWVILAVALALMALVAATSVGSTGARHRDRALGRPAASRHPRSRGADADGATAVLSPPTTAPAVTSTTSTAPPHSPSPGAGGATEATAGSVATSDRTPTTTPTTTAAAPAPTTTTSTTGVPAQPADRSVYPGYLHPPQPASTTYSFTGDGAMRISVTWSGTTYLTLTVSCPGFNQSAGGSSATALSVPDAQGSCQATVGEPGDEDAALTFSITIGPASGT